MRLKYIYKYSLIHGFCQFVKPLCLFSAHITLLLTRYIRYIIHIHIYI